MDKRAHWQAEMDKARERRDKARSAEAVRRWTRRMQECEMAMREERKP